MRGVRGVEVPHVSWAAPLCVTHRLSKPLLYPPVHSAMFASGIHPESINRLHPESIRNPFGIHSEHIPFSPFRLPPYHFTQVPQQSAADLYPQLEKMEALKREWHNEGQMEPAAALAVAPL